MGTVPMKLKSFFFIFLAPAALNCSAQNRVTEGIPDVPPELIKATRPYAELDTSVMSGWAPADGGLIVLKGTTGTTQAYLVKSPGPVPEQLTKGDDPVANIAVSPTHPFFIYTQSKDGTEVDQIYRFDIDTRKSTLLTDGRSRHSRPFICAANGLMAYGRLMSNEGKFYAELHLMDPRDPASDRVLLNVGGTTWSLQDWSPNGDKLLAMQRPNPLESSLWTMDLANGQTTQVPETSGRKPNYTFARFAPDGRALYVLSDRNSEFQQLGRLELASGQHTLLSGSMKWDIGGFSISPDGKRMAMVSNEHGDGALYTMTLDAGRPKKVGGLPPGIAYSIRWSSDSKRLAFGFVSSRATDEAYTFDLASGKIVKWTNARNQVPLDDVPPARLIKWKSFDGLELSGFLYGPSEKFKGRRPVIIDIHGGPNHQARPGFLTTGNYLLKELGVAYIYPNVRGSTGFGHTFQGMDDGVKRFDSVRDLGALLDFIAKQPDLDSSRVMVSGVSHGAYLALSVAATYPDRIRCAADFAGPSSLVSFIETTSGYRRQQQREEYGDERDPAVRKVLEEISPLANASKIRVPLLVAQGANDPRVPVSEAEQIVKAVKANGVPVWYLLFKDEGHEISNGDNSDYQFLVSLMFVKKFLLG